MTNLPDTTFDNNSPVLHIERYALFDKWLLLGGLFSSNFS